MLCYHPAIENLVVDGGMTLEARVEPYQANEGMSLEARVEPYQANEYNY